jgi:hypothetical protein
MSYTRFDVANLVDRWCVFYTRGLLADVATDRQDELRADVLDHLQWGRDEGASERAVTRAVLWRALKGMPSDLSWRRAQRRLVDNGGFGTRLFAGWLLLGASALGVGMVVLALTAIGRDRQGLPFGEGPIAPTLVAALVISCGVLLLLRQRTRWLGALWIAAGAPIVITTGANLLIVTTTVLFHVAQSTPLWSAGEVTIAVCVVVFYAAAAMWWMPDRSKAKAR